jgi:hypothetical protein
LIWKNRPNIQRRYIDVFSPAHSEQEKTAVLRQFLPRPPGPLKWNPPWEISLGGIQGCGVSQAKTIVRLSDSLSGGFVDVWLERWFDSELSSAVAGFASPGVSRSKFRGIQFRRGRLRVPKWVEAAKDTSARSQS